MDPLSREAAPFGAGEAAPRSTGGAAPLDAGQAAPCGAGETSQERSRPARLTHMDESGQARMVDVGAKPTTGRIARARARVRMSPATARAVAAGDAPKGEVLATARIAGIQAAKQTGLLIPLAHPINPTSIDVTAAVDPEAGLVELESEVRVSDRTGVEMEAMTACAVAALTVYDMVKGIERGVEIEEIVLLEKRGGRHDWVRGQGDIGPGDVGPGDIGSGEAAG